MNLKKFFQKKNSSQKLISIFTYYSNYIFNNKRRVKSCQSIEDERDEWAQHEEFVIEDQVDDEREEG